MSKSKKIQEIQILEQSIQNILLQKQAFQIELSETESAKKEIEKSSDDVFKVIGQIMIKTDKEKTIEELSNKEKLLSLRLKSIKKQEEIIKNKIESLQKEIIKEENSSK